MDEHEAKPRAAEGDPETPTVAEPHASRERVQALGRGQELGRYVILERLGAGGMGVVYAAYDPELDRRVAVKLLHDAHTATGRARLLREAQALARLQHPNVIAVHDVGTYGGRVFVAMEFVDGETLSAHIARAAPGWRQVVTLFLEAGRGLAAAHAAGLVHRDFKPDNVLVGRDGRVRVLDFGLARRAEGAAEGASEGTDGAADPSGHLLDAALTRLGVVAGTPAYIAPEQYDGISADARSDQYAFAVALWEALYGQLPVSGATIPEQIEATRAGKIDEPTAAARVPRWLRTVLERALARQPADRYRDMPELLAALADDPEARHRKILAASLAVVGVLAAGGAAWWWSGHAARRCAGSERLLAGIWDAPRKQEISRAFAATGLPFAASAIDRVARALDAWSAAWVAGRTDACEATQVRGEQSTELLDRRMSCLDGHLEDLAALSALLAEADAQRVEKSVQAVFALPPVAACADREALLARVPPPRGTEDQRRVEARRKEVARIRALRLAGLHAEGRAAADAAAVAFDGEAYLPLRGEFRLERAQLLQRLGAYSQSEALLEEASRDAVASRDAALAASAAAVAVSVVGVREARHADGERWASLGFAWLANLGGDDRLEAELRGNLASLYSDEGATDRALAEFERVLHLQDRLGETDSPERGRTLNNIGNAWYGRGDLEKARAAWSEALAVKERALGRDHPDLTSTLNNLALVLSDLERFDEARRLLARALAINEQRYGDEHPSVALELGNLAAIEEEAGRHADALAAARRALAIDEEAGGSDHPRLAFALTNIGNAELSLGQLRAARAAFGRALALREKNLEANHPQIAFPLTGIGKTLLAEGKPAEALAPLARAVRIRDAGEIDPALRAESRFQLGRARLASGGSAAEARRLVEQARAELVAAGSRPRRLLDEVEAWQKENGRPEGNRAP